jgi:hypothetical protein
MQQVSSFSSYTTLHSTSESHKSSSVNFRKPAQLVVSLLRICDLIPRLTRTNSLDGPQFALLHLTATRLQHKAII